MDVNARLSNIGSVLDEAAKVANEGVGSKSWLKRLAQVFKGKVGSGGRIEMPKWKANVFGWTPQDLILTYYDSYAGNAYFNWRLKDNEGDAGSFHVKLIDAIDPNKVRKALEGSMVGK